LKEAGGCFSVSTKNDLKKLLLRFREDPGFYRKSAAIARDYVQQQSGATKVILQIVSLS
jgi:hypothetical protein